VRHLAVVTLIAALAACSGTTSVAPFGGTYNLLSVDGTLEPQGLYPASNNPELVGGTLVVAADTLTVTLSVQSVDSAGHAVGAVTPYVFDIPYERQGNALLFANASPGTGGVVVGSSVELTFELPLVASTGFTAVARRFLFVPPTDGAAKP